MAHDGTGTGWDTAAPANTDPAFPQGAVEIRDLRIAVGIRANKEHDTYATSSAGGEHKVGSAKAYYGTSNPTLRPDGSTSLTSGDNGRLFINSSTGVGYYYSGSAWSAIVANGVVDGVIDADSLASNAVTTAKILNAAVTTAKLNDAAVTTDKLDTLAVTDAKLASDAVTTNKILNGAVTLAKLASGIIPTNKIYISSYTGDGSASLAVTGVGFQPDAMFFTGNYNYFLFAHKDNQGAYPLATFSQGGTSPLDGVQFQSDGFTVHTGVAIAVTHLNPSGGTVYYVALKGG